MIVLPNMGLVKWDSINDYFSHEQLAANFQSLDEHNHTPGKGKPIPYGGLDLLAVGPENVQPEIFSAESLASESIETSKIKDAAVTSRKVKLTNGVVRANNEKVLEVNETYYDVPGGLLEVTPAVPSILKITAVFGLYSLGGGGVGVAEGALKLDAEPETAESLNAFAFAGQGAVGSNFNMTVAAVYRFELSAALHKVQMRARKSNISNVVSSKKTCAMLWELTAS